MFRILRIAVLALACLALTQAAQAQAGQKQNAFHVDLTALNGSGVTGTADLVLTGDQLQVRLDLRGETPGKTHPQHIHGEAQAKGAAQCPTAAADSNGDGVLDHEEAEALTGGAVLPLEPFPTAAADGAVHFEHTYTVDPMKVGPLESRVIMVHGADSHGEYVAALPVACGRIEPASGTMKPMDH
jgi:Cu/Zn superoxide dismutase